MVAEIQGLDTSLSWTESWAGFEKAIIDGTAYFRSPSANTPEPPPVQREPRRSRSQPPPKQRNREQRNDIQESRQDEPPIDGQHRMSRPPSFRKFPSQPKSDDTPVDPSITSSVPQSNMGLNRAVSLPRSGRGRSRSGTRKASSGQNRARSPVRTAGIPSERSSSPSGSSLDTRARELMRSMPPIRDSRTRSKSRDRRTVEDALSLKAKHQEVMKIAKPIHRSGSARSRSLTRKNSYGRRRSLSRGRKSDHARNSEDKNRESSFSEAVPMIQSNLSMAPQVSFVHQLSTVDGTTQDGSTTQGSDIYSDGTESWIENGTRQSMPSRGRSNQSEGNGPTAGEGLMTRRKESLSVAATSEDVSRPLNKPCVENEATIRPKEESGSGAKVARTLHQEKKADSRSSGNVLKRFLRASLALSPRSNVSARAHTPKRTVEESRKVQYMASRSTLGAATKSHHTHSSSNGKLSRSESMDTGENSVEPEDSTLVTGEESAWGGEQSQSKVGAAAVSCFPETVASGSLLKASPKKNAREERRTGDGSTSEGTTNLGPQSPSFESQMSRSYLPQTATTAPMDRSPSKEPHQQMCFVRLTPQYLAGVTTERLRWKNSKGSEYTLVHGFVGHFRKDGSPESPASIALSQAITPKFESGKASTYCLIWNDLNPADKSRGRVYFSIPVNSLETDESPVRAADQEIVVGIKRGNEMMHLGYAKIPVPLDHDVSNLEVEIEITPFNNRRRGIFSKRSMAFENDDKVYGLHKVVILRATLDVKNVMDSQPQQIPEESLKTDHAEEDRSEVQSNEEPPANWLSGASLFFGRTNTEEDKATKSSGKLLEVEQSILQVGRRLRSPLPEPLPSSHFRFPDKPSIGPSTIGPSIESRFPDNDTARTSRHAFSYWPDVPVAQILTSMMSWHSDIGAGSSPSKDPSKSPSRSRPKTAPNSPLKSLPKTSPKSRPKVPLIPSPKTPQKTAPRSPPTKASTNIPLEVPLVLASMESKGPSVNQNEKKESTSLKSASKASEGDGSKVSEESQDWYPIDDCDTDSRDLPKPVLTYKRLQEQSISSNKSENSARSVKDEKDSEAAARRLDEVEKYSTLSDPKKEPPTFVDNHQDATSVDSDLPGIGKVDRFVGACSSGRRNTHVEKRDNDRNNPRGEKTPRARSDRGDRRRTSSTYAEASWSDDRPKEKAASKQQVACSTETSNPNSALVGLSALASIAGAASMKSVAELLDHTENALRSHGTWKSIATVDDLDRTLSSSFGVDDSLIDTVSSGKSLVSEGDYQPTVSMDDKTIHVPLELEYASTHESRRGVAEGIERNDHGAHSPKKQSTTDEEHLIFAPKGLAGFEEIPPPIRWTDDKRQTLVSAQSQKRKNSSAIQSFEPAESVPSRCAEVPTERSTSPFSIAAHSGGLPELRNAPSFHELEQRRSIDALLSSFDSSVASHLDDGDCIGDAVESAYASLMGLGKRRNKVTNGYDMKHRKQTTHAINLKSPRPRNEKADSIDSSLVQAPQDQVSDSPDLIILGPPSLRRRRKTEKISVVPDETTSPYEEGFEMILHHQTMDAEQQEPKSSTIPSRPGPTPESMRNRRLVGVPSKKNKSQVRSHKETKAFDATLNSSPEKAKANGGVKKPSEKRQQIPTQRMKEREERREDPADEEEHLNNETARKLLRISKQLGLTPNELLNMLETGE